MKSWILWTPSYTVASIEQYDAICQSLRKQKKQHWGEAPRRPALKVRRVVSLHVPGVFTVNSTPRKAHMWELKACRWLHEKATRIVPAENMYMSYTILQYTSLSVFILYTNQKWNSESFTPNRNTKQKTLKSMPLLAGLSGRITVAWHCWVLLSLIWHRDKIQGSHTYAVTSKCAGTRTCHMPKTNCNICLHHLAACFLHSWLRFKSC